MDDTAVSNSGGADKIAPVQPLPAGHGQARPRVRAGRSFMIIAGARDPAADPRRR